MLRLGHNLTKTFKSDKHCKQLILHVFAVVLRSNMRGEMDRPFTLQCNVTSNGSPNEIVCSTGNLVELKVLVTGKIILEKTSRKS